MPPLKGTLVGCGYFAQMQLEAWQRMPELVEMTALCDAVPERARRLAGKFDIDQTYADLERMLDETRPDFLDIVTRPAGREQLLQAAVDRGIHVLSQKPFAHSMEDAQHMVDYCRAGGVRLMVNDNWRWQPWYRRIKNAIDEGAIGRPFFLHLRFRKHDGLHDPPYPNQPYFAEMPRLLVFESVVHHIDTARFLAGNVADVACRMGRINDRIQGEDIAALTLTFDEGVIGLIDGNRCAPDENPGPVSGSARVEGTAGTLLLHGDGRIEHVTDDGHREYVASSWPETGYRGDSVYAAQRHFAECLRSGAPFETEGEVYLNTLEAVFDAYESAGR